MINCHKLALILYTRCNQYETLALESNVEFMTSISGAGLCLMCHLRSVSSNVTHSTESSLLCLHNQPITFLSSSTFVFSC